MSSSTDMLSFHPIPIKVFDNFNPTNAENTLLKNLSSLPDRA
jgi:hypothetical protein